MIVLQRWDGKPMHSYYFIQLFFMLIDTAVYNQSGMSVTVVIATSVSAFFCELSDHLCYWISMWAVLQSKSHSIKVAKIISQQTPQLL